MRILIIEDEIRAANQLQNMLKAIDFEYQLLAIIDTVEDAILWFQQYPGPDLVFMDIQLADGLSFEIFQKANVVAPIIFTTAFDQYAIQAFKVNSIDYLLKPVQQAELDHALKKFGKSSQQTAIDAAILKDLLHRMQATKSRAGILVKDGAGFIQVKISDILYFYAQDSIIFGVTATKRHIIDETIDQLSDSLAANQFFRINRSQVVAKCAIQKIEPYFNHRVKLTVANPRDQTFVVSRPKTTDFKAWMNS